VPKKEKKKKTFTSSASPEEQARLTKEAIKEIQRGISNPETRKPNTAFIPEGWHLRYREALGPYKQFVAAQSEHFKIHELNTGGWLLLSVGEEPPKELPMQEDAWKKKLSRAWSIYCAAVPQPERSIKNFIEGLPKGVSDVKPEPKVEKAAEKENPVPKAEKAAEKKNPVIKDSAEETTTTAAVPGTRKKKPKRKAEGKAEGAPKKKVKKASA